MDNYISWFRQFFKFHGSQKPEPGKLVHLRYELLTQTHKFYRFLWVSINSPSYRTSLLRWVFEKQDIIFQMFEFPEFQLVFSALPKLGSP